MLITGPKEQQEANLFALALLMPKDIFIEEFNKAFVNGIDLSTDKHPELKELADKFKVTQTAIVVRRFMLNDVWPKER